MRIIPAIDLIGGKCVRLTKGDYNTSKIYNENPLEVAKEFEAQGIEYLHVVDLDGAKSQHIVNEKILHDITQNTRLKVDFGGGIKSMEDVKIAFDNGANQITLGSVAVKNPELFLECLQLYQGKIILGADCKNRKIATHGWLEESTMDVLELIGYYEKEGVQSVICTDIAKDGMLEGPSFELYEDILKKSSVRLIASGGVSSLDDLIKLKKLGCDGAIVGKAIYEGKVDLEEINKVKW